MRTLSLLFASITASAVFACGKIAESDESQVVDPSDDAGTTPTTTRDASSDAAYVADADAETPDAACAPQYLRSHVCGDFYLQPCGVPKGVDPSDGLSAAECALVCPTPDGSVYNGCAEYDQDDLPGPTFGCYNCVEGRRPAGYQSAATELGTVAEWLAHAAELERVSIDAFEILRRELSAHAAPAELSARAERAAYDEVQHARVLGTLARRENATVREVEVVHGPNRSVLELALENAIEGCVRETYGALVAAWQAEHAQRPEIRRCMQKIQADETRHAELAWDVHDWAMQQLDAAGRARVDAAMHEAVRELEAAAELAPAPALISELGLPPRNVARHLVGELGVALWPLHRAA